MAKLRVTPFTSTSRFLVAGAVFLFALLIAAAAFMNGTGLEVRERLTASTSPANSRAAVATEIDQLLGRGGFSGQLLAYAVDESPADLQTMERLLDEAASEADAFSSLGSELFAYQFLAVVRGRIAQGRLALASISSGVRNTGVVAVEYAADLSGFDTAYARYRVQEQQLQTLSALNVLDLQRWITSLALAAAVFVMGAAAVLLYVNVRRPLRELAENLEDLLIDEEDRTLAESNRDDEIGTLARAAEKLRRTQLQAGRLLTLNEDGALRLRLEGANALAIDDALREVTVAADTLRSSALTLTTSGNALAEDGRDTLARVEVALSETIEETSGHLGALSEAGEDVLRLAGDLEGTRRSLATTETDWRDEMSNLAETMRGELDRLRTTTEHLAEMTEAAGTNVEGVSERLTEIATAWEGEQAALNDTSAQARENLTARLVTLDVQIDNLDSTLGSLEDLTTRAAPPIESAAGVLGRAVEGLSIASESASSASALMSREVEAARNARLSVISEAEADRAHWQKDRAESRQQADDMITQLAEAANRVDGLARDLTESSADVPGKLDRLTDDLSGLSGQIKSLEQVGGALTSQLGGRLTAVHEALGEARRAFADEAETIRGVTSDLREMHLTFEDESRAVGKQVGSIAETLEKLDGHLQSINQRMTTPVDLSPILAALKNEMGQAVTHLTQTVEGQGLNTQAALAESSGVHQDLVATGLSELSVRLDSKIAAQSDAAQRIAGTLSSLDERITELADVQRDTEQAVRQGVDASSGVSEIAALMEPKFEYLTHMAHAMGEELRVLADGIANRPDDATTAMVDQISRVEQLQGGLGQAQQAIALALHDGLKGIAHRLKRSDVGAVSKQLDSVVSTLVRQQDRLAEVMLDMSNDMGERIDDLAGEIARGNRQTREPRRGLLKKKMVESKTPPASADRVAQTPAPPENELSAIYDALKGLTEELKGLSVDEPEQAPDQVPKMEQGVPETDRKAG